MTDVQPDPSEEPVDPDFGDDDADDAVDADDE